MASFLDVCRFNPASSGTGNFLVSTAVQGYQTPAGAGAVNGATYRYRAESSDLSQWEVGYGTYTVSTTTLSRTTILFNSSGGTSAINFTAVPQVAIVALAEDLSTFLVNANNLSDVSSASTSRTNLGLGSSATLASSAVCQTANNLSDVGNTTTALENIGGISYAVSQGTSTAQQLQAQANAGLRATASLMATVASPIGFTATTTQLMVGLGGTFKLTPLFGTRIEFAISGNIHSSTGTVAFGQLYWGTGTAPSNGGSISGLTAVGSPIEVTLGPPNNDNFCKSVMVTGLTPGTAYWFDMSLYVNTGSISVTLTGVDFAGSEF